MSKENEYIRKRIRSMLTNGAWNNAVNSVYVKNGVNDMYILGQISAIRNIRDAINDSEETDVKKLIVEYLINTAINDYTGKELQELCITMLKEYDPNYKIRDEICSNC